MKELDTVHFFTYSLSAKYAHDQGSGNKWILKRYAI